MPDDGDIRFDEQGAEFGGPPQERRGLDMTGALVRWGLVSTRGQAQYVLLLIAAAALIAAFYFGYGALTTQTELPPPPPIVTGSLIMPLAAFALSNRISVSPITEEP